MVVYENDRILVEFHRIFWFIGYHVLVLRDHSSDIQPPNPELAKEGKVQNQKVFDDAVAQYRKEGKLPKKRLWFVFWHSAVAAADLIADGMEAVEMD